jgi:hypothetical protein
MFELITNANVFAPEPMGVRHLKGGRQLVSGLFEE